MALNKRRWYQNAVSQTNCWWCEYFTPECRRTAEHLIPKRYATGRDNSRKNVQMACCTCNNMRGWLEDCYSPYLKNSIKFPNYKERLTRALAKVPPHIFAQFCSCTKSKKVIEYYKRRWPTKWELHPFQPDILERLERREKENSEVSSAAA